MFTFSYGDLISIQYGLIPLKAVTTSFLCFKIKYSDPDDLAKLLFKATKDNHMYTHDNLDSLVDYMSKNTTGNCKGVLVYKAGRYGLINF